MTNKNQDQKMSREEAGRKGGEQSGGNFANDPQRAAQAGKKGGDATSASHDKEFYEDNGQKGGQESGGNFANDPERASEAGKKGGQNSHGGNG
ncbi:general stress protein [Vreelandella sp. EE22]